MKIYSKLNVLLIIVTLFIVVVGYISVDISQKALKDSIVHEAVYTAENIMRGINDDLYNKIEIIKNLTRTQNILEKLKESNDKFKGIENIQKYVIDNDWVLQQNKRNQLCKSITSNKVSEDLRNLINSFQLEYGFKVFAEIFITNKYGFNIAQSNMTSDYFQADEKWWKETKEKGVYLGEPSHDKSSDVIGMPMCVRIQNQTQEFSGIVKVIFNFESVKKLIYSMQTEIFGSRGDISIEDKNDKVIFTTLTDTEYEYFDNFHSDKSHHSYINTAVFIQPNTGVKKFCILVTPESRYEDINNLGWHIAIEYNYNEIFAPIRKLKTVVLSAFIILFIIILLVYFYIKRFLLRPVLKINQGVRDITKGNYDVNINIKSSDEFGILSSDFKKMAGVIKKQIDLNKQKEWLSKGLEQLSEILRQEKDLFELGSKISRFVSEYLDVQVATIYLGKNEFFSLVGSYSLSEEVKIPDNVKFRDTMLSQVFKNKKIRTLENIPDSYLSIKTSIGMMNPVQVVVLPLVYKGEAIGVMELAKSKEFSSLNYEYLNNISEPVAIAFNDIVNSSKLQNLLEESQQQAEELNAQQEELKLANEELQIQTDDLNNAQEKLQAQQEELKSSNEELEEKTEELEKQKKELAQKNQKLIDSEKLLTKKSEDLALSSKYKSEFLANMSHELRTPLNSLLLLSQKLSNNKDGNLTEKQTKNLKVIYDSGRDLLNMINEVLDLAKIESGKMGFVIEQIDIELTRKWFIDNFSHVAAERKLSYKVDVEDNVPESINTDRKKLEHILKNLVSNAIKFTENGGVEIKIYKPENSEVSDIKGLNIDNSIAFSVRDTGIGIPKDKLNTIFEAFQQADGSTSRKYGGSGLGLSISREYAAMLGGFVKLDSVEGQGSNFTLYVLKDLSYKIQEEKNKPKDTAFAGDSKIEKKIEAKDVKDNDTDVIKEKNEYPHVEDNRDSIDEGDKVILIIEDDLNFARILCELCKEKSYKFIHTSDGKTGLTYAKQYNPQGILLDIYLPESNGLQILDFLKDDLSTRHIPVHVMSADDKSISSLQRGAIGFLKKPVEKSDLEKAINKISSIKDFKTGRILLIEDDTKLCHSMKEMLDFKDIEIDFFHRGKEAMKSFEDKYYNLIIIDLDLPDISGFQVIEEIKKTDKSKPIIVYTGQELNEEEKTKLKNFSASTILKTSESVERLLDEVSLFLHTETEDLSEDKKKMLFEYHNNDMSLNGKTVLIVDDDVRNLYLLEEELRELNMKTVKAANGKMALEVLEKQKVDIVLMDIMMPVMNGYEAMSKIRKKYDTSNIPIIALTAKAMKGDRETCIEAGANDYLPKPIDFDKLITLMRVWINFGGNK